MTPADVAKGIDLGALALDLSKVPLLNGSSIEPEQVEAFVDVFFDALDAVNEYDDNEAPEVDEDGAREQPSDNELTTLDAQVAEEDEDISALNSIVPVEDFATEDQAVDVQLRGRDKTDTEEGIELAGPTDDELAAMIEDCALPDDGMMDQAYMLDALNDWDDLEAGPKYTEGGHRETPIIDLSVLDRPWLSRKEINKEPDNGIER